MDLSPVRNRVYYCRPLAYVLTPQQLCGTEHCFQHIDADKRYSRNYILPQQPQGSTELGLVGGIIDLILGIYLIAYPMVSMEVIPFIIAFWLMFRGFSSTGYSIDLKRYGTRDWGWYMAFGILAIICALIILWQPAVGALYVVYMISFTFFIIGLFRVMLSFELRNLHKRK